MSFMEYPQPDACRALMPEPKPAPPGPPSRPMVCHMPAGHDGPHALTRRPGTMDRRWEGDARPARSVAPSEPPTAPDVRIRTELPWIDYDHRCEHRAAAADRKLVGDEFYALFRSEAEAGRAMRNAVLDIHKPVPTWTDSTYDERGVQVEQNALYDDAGVLIAAPDYRIHCAACPVDTEWPCPTARAMGVTS